MNQEKIAEIFQWYITGKITSYIASNHCGDRGLFNGRISSYEPILSKNLSKDCVYLVSSSLGEIGNNCFDHNLGFWQSEPGCLFIREQKFSIICDRGRGIKSSLSPVYKLSSQDLNYVAIAFQKIITGRSPEKRGNGLKFVRKNINHCGLGLLCKSDSESYHVGKERDLLSLEIESLSESNSGVFTYIYW